MKSAVVFFLFISLPVWAQTPGLTETKLKITCTIYEKGRRPNAAGKIAPYEINGKLLESTRTSLREEGVEYWQEESTTFDEKGAPQVKGLYSGTVTSKTTGNTVNEKSVFVRNNYFVNQKPKDGKILRFGGWETDVTYKVEGNRKTSVAAKLNGKPMDPNLVISTAKISDVLSVITTVSPPDLSNKNYQTERRETVCTHKVLK